MKYIGEQRTQPNGWMKYLPENAGEEVVKKVAEVVARFRPLFNGLSEDDKASIVSRLVKVFTFRSPKGFAIDPQHVFLLAMPERNQVVVTLHYFVYLVLASEAGIQITSIQVGKLKNDEEGETMTLAYEGQLYTYPKSYASYKERKSRAWQSSFDVMFRKTAFKEALMFYFPWFLASEAFSSVANFDEHDLVSETVSPSPSNEAPVSVVPSAPEVSLKNADGEAKAFRAKHTRYFQGILEMKKSFAHKSRLAMLYRIYLGNFGYSDEMEILNEDHLKAAYAAAMAFKDEVERGIDGLETIGKREELLQRIKESNDAFSPDARQSVKRFLKDRGYETLSEIGRMDDLQMIEDILFNGRKYPEDDPSGPSGPSGPETPSETVSPSEGPSASGGPSASAASSDFVSLYNELEDINWRDYNERKEAYLQGILEMKKAFANNKSIKRDYDKLLRKLGYPNEEAIDHPGYILTVYAYAMACKYEVETKMPRSTTLYVRDQILRRLPYVAKQISPKSTQSLRRFLSDNGYRSLSEIGRYDHLRMIEDILFRGKEYPQSAPSASETPSGSEASSGSETPSEGPSASGGPSAPAASSDFKALFDKLENEVWSDFKERKEAYLRGILEMKKAFANNRSIKRDYNEMLLRLGYYDEKDINDQGHLKKVYAYVMACKDEAENKTPHFVTLRKLHLLLNRLSSEAERISPEKTQALVKFLADNGYKTFSEIGRMDHLQMIEEIAFGSKQYPQVASEVQSGTLFS